MGSHHNDVEGLSIVFREPDLDNSVASSFTAAVESFYPTGTEARYPWN
jgi:hypothetical protein